MQVLAAISAFVQARLARDNEEGATAVEYGLIVSLIALAIIAGVTAFGSHLGTFFSNLQSKF
jgi:pilus assembly protein Flp/PilA